MLSAAAQVRDRVAERRHRQPPVGSAVSPGRGSKGRMLVQVEARAGARTKDKAGKESRRPSPEALRAEWRRLHSTRDATGAAEELEAKDRSSFHCTQRALATPRTDGVALRLRER